MSDAAIGGNEFLSEYLTEVDLEEEQSTQRVFKGEQLHSGDGPAGLLVTVCAVGYIVEGAMCADSSAHYILTVCSFMYGRISYRDWSEALFTSTIVFCTFFL